MAKRSDTLETVKLAVELLRRIPRGRKVTASELHEQLQHAGIERELRTIQRQLEMLSEHFEIERDDSSKPYGYRWLEQAKALAVPNLTPQESLLLQLAEEHLKNLLPPRLMKSMDAFFSQARRNLGLESSARLEREWPGKVRVVATSQPLLPPKIVPGVFEAVSEALYSNHWLHIEYKNAGGKRTSADVMPLGLVQQGSRLYLVCRYQGFDNERNLALHRIASAEVSTLTFERPKTFDLKRYDDDGRFGFGEGEKVRLSFRIERSAGLHLMESPLSTDQKVIERKDGQLEITATVVDSAMLEWWLRGFGNQISAITRKPPGDNP
ncbi:transcriptional regulator [Acidovorax sp. Root267]|uniref:helix-turn-helix transcriptional regulator n=1 Tax=Acidovorax sp. Root267 TaxID=1736505 RepID=UPI0007102A94|nr:WYL domain-containing protein [Acidovorax sp. Root267]KRD25624.1 transcriptional regulator [Acidovorax sp. Root267]